MSGERIAIDPRCWDDPRLGLPEPKRRYLRNLAERVTADGLLIYNPAAAEYLVQPHLFDGCAGPVPTEAAVAVVEGAKPKPPEPVPYAEWPWWAKLVAKRRKDGEAGVGSTFERLAAGVGGKRFEAWAKRRGINCGCAARRSRWDQTMRYSDLPAG